MRAYERLLEYVKIDTQSSEETDTVPSTAGQLTLAERRNLFSVEENPAARDCIHSSEPIQ